MRNAFFLPAAMVAPLLLTGCSGEPSQSEISTSVSTFMTELGRIVATQAPRPLAVDDVEKHGCTLERGMTYVCDVTLTVSGGYMPQPQTRTAPMRFTRMAEGWVASE
ncbi:hypothetical protein [Aureimonas jatrophae]|uniref:Lipoprotein n=1 Tax=Aureimonas jatrophae TaxID=1166073 RepID=A0A1H0M4K0_9HYPH|nr:hypothetical protein [Aureimonas jatrophae]MBB3952624.1 hypothetical protein [Aureimonas jatrophae]SDO75422.1 hypothetical protein SAMN05192530_11268 [Aureimonas jatrophae]